MRLIPRSLGGRLLLGAGAFVAVALIIAGFIVEGILDRFIHGQLDQRLDGQIAAIEAALASSPQGALRLTQDVDAAPFDRPMSGWYWRASSERGSVSSLSLGDGADLSADIPRRPPHHQGRPWPAKGRGPGGEPLHLRVHDLVLGDDTVRVIAAAPQHALIRPLRDALLPLTVSLAALGAGLMAALVLQVRLGLLPLRRLGAALVAVRSGAIARIPPDQPAEIAPLVAELNGLLDQNEERLTRARRHLANLAHGLKTPLATMAVTLREPGRDPERKLAGLVENMDRLIRHHLARARAAAQHGGTRARTDVVQRIRDIAAALTQIHSEALVAMRISAPDSLLVAAESQDVDELLGNIMDNAFRFAATEVRVDVAEAAMRARLVIEDDGPGLLDAAMIDALRPGERLDESAPGYGFGLTIAREIAELYGGDLTLGRSPRGGLRVNLILPLAAPQAE